MPTYDYECGACGKTTEIFHPMSETKKKCPKCGKSALTRLIGPGSGFLFRGSGFYITDYRSPDYKSKAESEKPKPAESEKPKTAEAEKAKSAETEKAKTSDSQKAKPSESSKGERESRGKSSKKSSKGD